MKPYIHKVQYYETDKMGVTHHSNYIRWMEEARVDFLDRIGFSFERLEAEGLSSPILSVDCKYKLPTRFGDLVNIDVTICELKHVRMNIEYTMKNSDGEVVCTGHSELAFFDKEGKPMRLEKDCPEFYKALTEAHNE